MTPPITPADPAFERNYRAVASRDPRFDGYFFTAVTTTGIYCRPSCPAMTPRRDRVRFYPTAAAAQGAGFRACKRCIPGAAPGSPEWDVRGDVAGRAMHLIDEGLVDREGVPGLARRLGYGERQLRRILIEQLGAAPLALARAQRAGVARTLLETTDLPITDVAFAAGFASLRQFNDTVREVYATTPTELRARGHRGRGGAGVGPAGGGGTLPIELRLPRRDPFDLGSLLAFLAPRSIPGVESVAGDTYVRSLRLPSGPALAAVRDDGRAVRVTLHLADPRDLAPAVARVRRLLDLDADPVAVAEVLGADPVLGPLVADSPGRRAPGAVDGLELAIRAICGQQVSVASATAVVGRIAGTLGQPLPAALAGVALGLGASVTSVFPAAEALADAPDDALPVPAPRRTTIRSVARAVADGSLVLGPGADRAEAAARLSAIPGVGPWTAGYIALRALGDPDVLLTGDLGVRKAAARLGLPDDERGLAAAGASWAPWRSYATHHLWASLASPAPALTMETDR
ncbi:MAG: AlkA N-terminal domain-containing protein [Chloroflexota bacterium]